MPSSMISERKDFEQRKKIFESALLTFKGVEGFDVYNCSVPFHYKGQLHIFGRVERNYEWANSTVRLFVKTGKDEFTVVPGPFVWQLEDPFLSKIDGEYIFGGTSVRKTCGDVSNYCCSFYRGVPDDFLYFTSGPDNMKDIRLVQLNNGQIGVFSRPKTTSTASIGFIIIDKIIQLGAAVIAKAEALDLLEEGAWGGVNQAYLLSSGWVGCIAHYSYADYDAEGNVLSIYVNYAFVLEPFTRVVKGGRIIGSKGCYPNCTPKVPRLVDCAFVSGIVMREDGKCDLYSGLGDAAEGRIVIDYPFEGFGEIVQKNNV